MGASVFQFQQFRIQQDRCAMKVSTDGILLGAWAPELKSGRILDIGTGTGLLALMGAQRNPSVLIEAIEIEPEAAGQAGENFSLSPWRGRIKLHEGSLQDFQPENQFDLFLCNPPYFSDGIRSSRQKRQKARHEDSLDFIDMAYHSARLATEGAKIAMIIPFERMEDMEVALTSNDWFLQKRTLLKAVPHKAPQRILLLAGRKEAPFSTQEETIANESGQYSEWFRSLTGAFYL